MNYWKLFLQKIKFVFRKSEPPLPSFKLSPIITAAELNQPIQDLVNGMEWLTVFLPWCQENCRSGFRYNGRIVSFDDPKEAMLFKLTFG